MPNVEGIIIDEQWFEHATMDALSRGVEAGLLRAGLAIEREAKKLAPVDTGSLRSSIHLNQRGRGILTVITVGPNVKSAGGAPYDVFQELGTGLEATVWGGDPAGGRHYIVPRRGRFLAFRSRGEGWGRVTSHSWTVGEESHTISYGGSKVRSKWGVTRVRETSMTTKFHGDMAFARRVRGVKARRYMQQAIEKAQIAGNFIIGWNSAS